MEPDAFNSLRGLDFDVPEVSQLSHRHLLYFGGVVGLGFNFLNSVN